MEHERQTPHSEVVNRFSVALNSALYDRGLEREKKDIAYYYDADVMFSVVAGFLDRHTQYTPANERVNLMRALLSSGYLGHVRMLRPHVLELDAELRNKLPEFGKKSSAGQYSRQVREFVKVQGVLGEMRRLRRIAKSKRPESEIARLFIHFMQESGYRSFPILEVVNGTWIERLNRLLAHNLTFDHAPQDVRSVMQSRSFTRFHEILYEESGLYRSAGSNMRDALALALLHEAIRGRESGESVPIVRFYTETITLHRLWSQHKEVRDMLSYGSGLGGEFDFIVRDPDYFILRAAFQELRFPELSAVTTKGEATWEELSHIGEQLSSCLRDRPKELNEHLETLQLGGVKLREVIEQFESLALVRNVWSKYSLPTSLQQYIRTWSDVWEMAEKYLDDALVKQLHVARNQLHEEVEKLQTWTSRSLRVSEAAEGVSLRFRPADAPLPDPMRDLGIVRWGIRLSAAAEEELQEHVAVLLRGNATEKLSLCAKLADFVDHPVSSSDDFGVFAATLWFLEVFDLISAAVRRYDDLRIKEPLDASIYVIDIVAQLRADPQMSATRKAELLASIERIEHQAARSGGLGYLLAVGYSYFIAWQSETRALRSGSPTDLPDVMQEWARKSFLAGITGTRTYPAHTLEWAFSINHVVYVGTVTSQALGEVQDYVDLLVQLRGQPAFWHYRFADTLAYHNYVYAKMEWQLLRLRARTSEKREMRIKICRLLQQGFDLLEEEKYWYGDPEIPQHKLEITRLIAEVGCDPDPRLG